MVFKLDELGYRGYIAKIKLLIRGLEVVLAGDKPGNLETTANAVKRTGAILGINGGGFYNAGGRSLPIGNTVIDGKLVGGFTPRRRCFCRYRKKRLLYRRDFYQKRRPAQTGSLAGVSFLPVPDPAGATRTHTGRMENHPPAANYYR